MEWAACVGVDWSDQKHAYAVRTRDGEEYAGEFKSDPQAVHQWVRTLRERHPSGVIVVALEQSRGPLMYALSMYDFLALVPLNPRAVSAYRESLHLSGAKDDPTDAVLIRDFAAAHLSMLRVWRAADAKTRKLRLLVEGRRNFVDQRTGLSHALSATLKQYFPHVLDWFGDVSSTLTRAFLLRWPTLEQAKAARPDAIRRVIRAYSRKKPDQIEALLAKIDSAVPLTTDAAIIEALSELAQSLVTMLDAVDQPIRRYDQQIAALWADHPDRAIFESFPGAGPVLAPRLAAGFGTDRTRFSEPAEMQNYSGIAPVIEASGKYRWVHARWQCPKFLRQSFHEFAEASLPYSSWALAFYRQQRDRGAGHHTAIRALAFRWIRILHKCWVKNIAYDEQTYIDALKRRHSPLISRLAA